MSSLPRVSPQTYTLFLFPNTHFAIQAERTLKSEASECEARLIPLPPEISAGCGMVLRVPKDYTKKALDALKTASVELEGIYSLQVVDKKRLLQKLDMQE